MKKKNLFLVIILLMFIVITQNVSAKTYKVTRRKNVYHKYSLRYKLNPNDVEESVYVNLYQATIDGIEADTYCVDPGKKYGDDGDYVVKDDTVDPTTNNPRDLAIAGALKEIDNYRKQGVGGDDLKLVGDIAMRWVFMYYGGGISSEPPIYIPGTSVVSVLWKAWNAFSKPEYAYSVNDNEAIIKYAKNVYASAVKAASAGSYSNAVAQGYIYSPEYTSANYRVTKIVGNTRTVTFELKPKDSSLNPTKVYENFEAGCTNTTVKCTITEQNRKNGKYEPAGILIEMTIDTTNWNKQDFGIYVDPAYCDSKDAASQIVILRKENGDTQRMLAVLPGSCPVIPEIKIKRPRIPVYADDCECNYPDGKTWDGTYTLRKYKNGNLIGTEKIDAEKDKSKVSEYSCPSADYCKNKTNNTCQKPSESTDGKYHCPNPTLPDGSCSEKEYKEQCTHNCDPDGETDEPDEAKHNSTNTFYCKESSPGAGDGKVCSEAEHNAQCHKNYVDCSPVVSLPGTCSNISDGSKIEGTTTGVISDINEGDASCSSNSAKPNQIKKCVLGKTDSTSASYEATNEISGNSYCKVYCKEKYNFVLPTAKMTTSGGYFKLNTTVTGTRDCYVASASNSQLPIDETKFNNDLVAAQHALIDAWNEYHYYDIAASIKASLDNDGCSNHQCSGSESIYTKEWSGLLYDYSGKTHEFDGKNDKSWTSPNKTEYTGKYKSGTAASCTGSDTKDGCDHTCTDGTAGDDPDADDPDKDDDIYHEESKENALKVLQQKAKELNDIIAMYNSCTGVIGNTNYASSLTDATTSSTAQSTWNNDMQFNPVVEFWYNQDYLQNVNDLSSGWAKFTNLTDESDTSKNTYCTGDINDSYECTTGTSSKEPIKSVQILTCAENNCSWKSYNVSSAKWITKSKTKSGTYQTSQNFSTYTPYGTIKTDSNGNKYLYTTLPEGSWPISLVTKTGVFPFKFRFSDIGQSNSSTDLGRLSDSNESGKNTVVNAYDNLPPGLKCGGESKAYTDGGYVCNYLNNCTDNCDFSCDPNDPTHCTFNTCDSGKCVVTCTNCIFDGNKTTYGYRTVSLNNLFPNGISGRGYNWSGEGISNQKSSDTKKEIEEAGDSIYETPQYSYTLTPSNMKNIRDYNDDAGSFTNSTVPSKYSVKSNINDSSIYCESVSYNGVTYNVNCKSSFLDLIETTGKKFATQNERITTDNDAFILYTSTNSCLEGSCLKNGIGPSWKLKGSSKQ